MTKLGPSRKLAQRLGRLAGIVLALSGGLACNYIIEVVPRTPSPVAVSQVTTPSTDETTPSGLPRRIVAGAIGLDAPVVEMGWRAVEQDGQLVSEWDMPENEAAWHRNTARPGEASNVVISGHNASTGGHVFAELDELQVGDEIELWNDKNEPISYYVVEKNIVRLFINSEEAQNYLQNVMKPTAKEQLTLITCWPRWSNTHRLIVIAEPY
jgi:sortase A